MSKDGYQFAAAHLIDKLMYEFETNYLSQYTPCNYTNEDDLAYSLAIVHVELIIIHPFREGNGRLARLLANLMALQAGKRFINYSPIDRTSQQKGFDEYIMAIHQGHCGDYKMMQKIFYKLLEAS